jgi:hypothetical protein
VREAKLIRRMRAFKKYPFFVSALTVCGGCVAGEGWCLYERWSAAQDATAVLERKNAELRAMAGLVPAPTRAVAEAVAADLAQAEQARAAVRAELQGRGPAAERLRTAKPPAARTEAFFDLAAFVEKTRERAKALEVEVKPGAARFGFALYAHEGPEPERIAAVFHQRQIAHYLVESLLAAKPRSLLAVQREVPLTGPERAALAAERAAAASGAPPPPDAVAPTLPEGPDFFAIDPRASARVPGYLETTAFKVAFVGQTAALRAWLNQLAGFELPVLVREVEVVPATGAEVAADAPAEDEEAAALAPPAEPVEASVVLRAKTPAPASRRVAPSAPRPAAAGAIVARPWSKFTVTVEYIELVPPAGAAPETAAGPAQPAS